MNIVKKLIKEIASYISKMKTMNLFTILCVLGVIFAIFFWLIGLPENKFIAALELSIIMIIWGMSGLLFIIRREAPIMPKMVKGLPAVIFGAFLILIFLSIIIVLIINTLIY